LDDSFQSTDHSMKYPNIYIGFLLLLIFSCEDKPPQQTENAIPAPEVITKEIVAKYQDCQVDSLSCTYARIAYPQFTDSSMQKLNEAIADKVHDHAANFMMEDSAHEDLNAVANAFVDDYARFVQEFTDYKLGWYLKISAEVIYESIEFISLMIDIETFTGGAHPNATTN
jgi:hypothetical protein